MEGLCEDLDLWRSVLFQHRESVHIAHFYVDFILAEERDPGALDLREPIILTFDLRELYSASLLVPEDEVRHPMVPELVVTAVVTEDPAQPLPSQDAPDLHQPFPVQLQRIPVHKVIELVLVPVETLLDLLSELGLREGL